MKTDDEKIPTLSVHRLEASNGSGDHALLSFARTGDRTDGQLVTPISDTQSLSHLRKLLLNAGAYLPTRAANGDPIIEALSNMPDDVGILTSSTGWIETKQGPVFVLPGNIIGKTDTVIVLSDAVLKHCISNGQSGTLESWRKHVADPCETSPAASIAVLVALAGPLYSRAGLSETFIFNLAGNSSSGKSTANYAAASAWGHPSRMESWSGTSRGLIEIAAANTDLCLILDDVEKADDDPKKRFPKVNGQIHALTSEKSKTYAQSVSSPNQLPSLKLRVLVLSSSPQSLEANFSETGTSRTDGDRARLLEIVVPHGDQGGIWQPIDGGQPPENTAALSDALKAASQTHYGTAGPALVEFIIANLPHVGGWLQKYRSKFRSTLSGTDRSVSSRIADKVSLLYATGRIAIRAEILGWSKERVLEVAQHTYNSILETSNLNVFDPAAALEKLVPLLKDRTLVPIVNTSKLAEFCLEETHYGCVHRAEKRLYLRLKYVRQILDKPKPLTALHHTEVIKYAIEQGLLIPGPGNSPTKDIRLKDEKIKLMVFDTDQCNALLRPKNGGKTVQ